MKQHARIGLSGIDTRALTRRIRTGGAPNGVIAHSASGTFDIPLLLQMARAWPGLEGMDLAITVSCETHYGWEGGVWRHYGIEINLRKGGTTHPFLTLQFLTDGTYDAEAGQFVTPTGDARHLVATDHLEDEALKALTVDDLFDVMATRRLHFDQSRQAGVVLHMMSSVTEAGRIGLTAVADSAEAARGMFDTAQHVLVEEARAALAETALA